MLSSRIQIDHNKQQQRATYILEIAAVVKQNWFLPTRQRKQFHNVLTNVADENPVHLLISTVQLLGPREQDYSLALDQILYPLPLEIGTKIRHILETLSGESVPKYNDWLVTMPAVSPPQFKKESSSFVCNVCESTFTSHTAYGGHRRHCKQIKHSAIAKLNWFVLPVKFKHNVRIKLPRICTSDLTNLYVANKIARLEKRIRLQQSWHLAVKPLKSFCHYTQESAAIKIKLETHSHTLKQSSLSPHLHLAHRYRGVATIHPSMTVKCFLSSLQFLFEKNCVKWNKSLCLIVKHSPTLSTKYQLDSNVPVVNVLPTPRQTQQPAVTQINAMLRNHIFKQKLKIASYPFAYVAETSFSQQPNLQTRCYVTVVNCPVQKHKDVGPAALKITKPSHLPAANIFPLY